MPITFGRAPGVAEVAIDVDLCTVCGQCVEVCPGGPLFLEEDHIGINQSYLLGCIACGQCMAVCPTGAVTVHGRDLTPEDCDTIPAVGERAGYPQLMNRMLARRSVRSFTSRPVEREVLDQILAAAATAPMGLPPSEVGVLIMPTHDQVQAFRLALTGEIRKVKWMLTPFWSTVLSSFFGGGEQARMMRDFIVPVAEKYTRPDPDRHDWFFYDAPAALYFYGSEVADPADAILPASLAMLAAESLGLGTCLLGFPGYIVNYSMHLKKKYGLPKRIQPGLTLIMGYPTMMYHQSILRRFARVAEVMLD